MYNVCYKFAQKIYKNHIDIYRKKMYNFYWDRIILFERKVFVMIKAMLKKASIVFVIAASITSVFSFSSSAVEAINGSELPDIYWEREWTFSDHGNY